MRARRDPKMIQHSRAHPDKRHQSYPLVKVALAWGSIGELGFAHGDRPRLLKAMPTRGSLRRICPSAGSSCCVLRGPTYFFALFPSPVVCCCVYLTHALPVTKIWPQPLLALAGCKDGAPSHAATQEKVASPITGLVDSFCSVTFVYLGVA